MPTSTLAAPARRLRKKAQPARRAAASRSGTAPPKPAASQAPTNSRPAAYALPPSADQLMHLQQDYWTQLASLWTDFFQNPAKSSEPIADSRFSDPAWQNNPLASFYARAYLLNSDFMNRLAGTIDGDRKTKQRVKFAVSQWVDAAWPSNCGSASRTVTTAVRPSSTSSLVTSSSLTFSTLAVFMASLKVRSRPCSNRAGKVLNRAWIT